MIHSFEWLLVEAGTSLFEIILIITFLSCFLDAKETSRIIKSMILTGCFILLFIGSSYLYNIPNVLVLNFFILSMIISFFLFDGKPSQIIFSCSLLLAILSLAEIIAVYILALTMKVEATRIQSDPILKFIGVIIKDVLSFTIVRIIYNYRKSSKSSSREVGKTYMFFLLIVPAICTVVMLTMLDMVLSYKIQNLSMVLISSLGLMYINAIIFVIFEGLMRQLDKGYRYNMIEKQLELQINHYNKLAENRAQLSEVIHDFKNHLNCIYNLYKYNNSAELGKYIENLINVTNAEKVIDTGNPVIDALLNDKYNIAQKTGIDFKRELNLPSNLKIESTDICAVLGNSLDNAIEACRRIKNKALHPEIDLSMTYRDSYLVIVVSNTIDQIPLREGKFFRSSKPSPELHGLGMHSIERTVKKYDGNMVVKCEQGFFKLEIVMLTA